MLKRQVHFDELLTEEPIVGEPVIIRIGKERVRTSPVVKWHIGLASTRIETEHTVYIK